MTTWRRALLDTRAIWPGENVDRITRDQAKNFVHFGCIRRLGTAAITGDTQNRHT
jgi:hypothetical protein